MSRKTVAYICSVKSIEDIPGKDRIKYISFNENDWQVISNVHDNPLHVGQGVIYIEYDTIINATPPAFLGCKETPFEFLRKSSYSEKYNGFKIRAMNMAGFVSYGLIVSCDVLKHYGYNPMDFDIGSDVGGYLGIKSIDELEAARDDINKEIHSKSLNKFQRFVKKYLYFLWKHFQPPKTSGDFPSQLVSKTDETRIENLSYLWDEKYRDMDVYATTKMDGSSITFGIHKGMFYLASRNTAKAILPIKKAIKHFNQSKEKSMVDNFYKVACKYDLPNKLSKLKMDIFFQGELCGPGIQKNRLGLADHEVYIFNVFDPKARRFFSLNNIHKFSDMIDVPVVLTQYRGKFKWTNKAEIKEFVKGNYPNGHPQEGIVFRADTNDTYTPTAERGMSNMWSFKVINDDFATLVG